MKRSKPIAVPAYLRQPVHAPGTYGLHHAARLLRMEAKFYRRAGQPLIARALEIAASDMNRIGPQVSPAVAFDWPEPLNGEVPRG
jgi:hypothetical protein